MASRPAGSPGAEYTNEPSGSPWPSVGEVLGEHLPVHPAVGDANADPAVAWVQNVCAVAGAVHQAVVGDLDGRREGKVLAGRPEVDAAGPHAVERGGTA